ncbi:hypothetical protein ACRRTK_011951 [Alexandromys fortis]
MSNKRFQSWHQCAYGFSEAKGGTNNHLENEDLEIAGLGLESFPGTKRCWISAVCDCHASIQSIRSTDYGTTYEKLNDKVGLKTVLSYLYVNPTNKRKALSQLPTSTLLVQMAPALGCLILDSASVFSILLASPVTAAGLMASSCASV